MKHYPFVGYKNEALSSLKKMKHILG